MSDILDFYQQRAKSSLSHLPWLAQLQTKALSDLNQHGFPTRHDEDWKYTSVDALLSQPFMQFDAADSYKESAVHSSHEKLNSRLQSPHQVVIENGHISGFENLAKSLPQGVLVLPLSEALNQYPELLKNHLGSILKQEHGLHYLNTAMIHCGMMIYIPAGVVIEDPILLTHVQSQTNQAVYLRHLIIAEENSQAHVIEDYQGDVSCVYLTSRVTEVVVAAGAKLTHYTLQRESKSAYHFGHLSVKQLAGSEFINHSLSLGGKWVRSDISLYLQEEKAHALMNGIYAPAEGQHVDHHTTVQHLVPNCSSEQDYKGILTGRSRAVFNGKVVVARDAQHTDAKQQNKNLLLSANAEVDTKPQLEIFADDVLCSHGATVGQLDEEALFYLATRGIGRLEASHYLIHAFASDNLRLISHRPLADYMGHLLTQQLG
ncbi:component of SufBCD complex [Legionella wadsworthii]|uniref:Component of SufBCD complex n=1 Tax=Legionella wadsworthii TaxID=28088 RepID=A0A378LQW0_9GAMM|nr:Fe-S cluster assembly protein SufD [Legionella wadsworthii]STY28199.1 component of SufBCD complex [Legionella wadsworthii]